MKKRGKKVKVAVVALLFVMLIPLLSACGQAKMSAADYLQNAETATYDMEDGYESNANYAMEEEGIAASGTSEKMEEASGETVPPADDASGQKLIKTVDLDVETERFEELMYNLESKIVQLGGYIENQYTYNGSAYAGTARKERYGNLTARIPEEKLEDFLANVSENSNVISKNTSTENVTLAYVDVESRKKMYLAEQESLLQLLAKAETVEDITYLTSSLTEVRYNIENMESQLRTYDNQVDYATVNLNVAEVEVLTPTTVAAEKSVGEEIAEGFMANLRGIGNSFAKFGINFVINLPNIILFLIWCAIIFFIVRLIIYIVKRMTKKNQEKAAAARAERPAGTQAAAGIPSNNRNQPMPPQKPVMEQKKNEDTEKNEKK